MRIKDSNKEKAIVDATIQMVNEIGFVNISMSKIAKVAGVSTSALYTYYENKEDMFQKIYLDVKKDMLSSSNKGISSNDPLELTINKFCRNILAYATSNQDKFLFLEQSVNSPLVDSFIDEEIEKYLQDTLSIFKEGSRNGTLKNASPYLLVSFCVYPITQIYKEHCYKGQVLTDIDFDLVFEMCWDAIKA